MFVIGFEQPVYTFLESNEQHMLGVRVDEDFDEIAGEAAFNISTADGSAVGKLIGRLLSVQT